MRVRKTQAHRAESAAHRPDAPERFESRRLRLRALFFVDSRGKHGDRIAGGDAAPAHELADAHDARRAARVARDDDLELGPVTLVPGIDGLARREVDCGARVEPAQRGEDVIRFLLRDDGLNRSWRERLDVERARTDAHRRGQPRRDHDHVVPVAPERRHGFDDRHVERVGVTEPRRPRAEDEDLAHGFPPSLARKRSSPRSAHAPSETRACRLRSGVHASPPALAAAL